MNTPIGVALARLAAAEPNRPAVTSGPLTLTRSELEARTNRLARLYLERGVRPGAFVTIGLPNGVEFLEAVIAAWKIGATPQPVSHRLPPRELDQIIALANPDLMVGLPGTAGRPYLAVGHIVPESLGADPLPDAIAPSLKAPTSGGSTGRPKLIVSTDAATAESLLSFATLLRLNPGGVALSTGPLSHNGPFLTACAALLAGCHVVVMERFDAAAALELIGRHQVDWMYSVPAMLSRIAALGPEQLDRAEPASLRTVITMAATCSERVREFCLDFFGPDVMLELYGATEAHAFVMTDGHGWRRRPGSVGRTVIGEIQIRDTLGVPVPPGQVGELWMRRSPDLAGPYRYIGSTAQRSADGWETVGDLGSLDAEGYLYLADRKTDMVVVGGSNVYPAEVESALEEHPAVLAACVVGLPDDELGQTVHAVVNVARPVADADLWAHLRECLVPYKIPRSIERSAELLRDEAGKLRRGRIREQLLQLRATPDLERDPQPASVGA